MPKGETSRPTPRKAKGAMARNQDRRDRMDKSTAANGGTPSVSAFNAINGEKGTSADAKSHGDELHKRANRVAANKSERANLTSTKEMRTRTDRSSGGGSGSLKRGK